MASLYHYTCSHAAPLIKRDGLLKLHPQPLLGGMPLIWFTDMDAPDRAALGLTSHTLKCDRTAFRVDVEAGDAIVRWFAFARPLPIEARRRLEFAPGVLPAHWYVSRSPYRILAVTPTALARAS